MNTYRFSQRGQASTTSIGVVIFFLLYFTFVMTLIWLVEGITPIFLTKDVTWMAIGSVAVVAGAIAAAAIVENIPLGGGAHVASFHLIRFAILGVIAGNIGIPLLDAVNKSAMFNDWLIAIFIIIPFIAFTVAAFQITMSGGGGA